MDCIFDAHKNVTNFPFEEILHTDSRKVELVSGYFSEGETRRFFVAVTHL